MSGRWAAAGTAARSTTLVALAAGLVAGAGAVGTAPDDLVDPTVDVGAVLGAPQPDHTLRATTGGAASAPGGDLVALVELGCPGPAQQGLQDGGMPEQEQTVQVGLASAPRELLPAATPPDGSVTLAEAPGGVTARSTDAAGLPGTTVDGPAGVVVSGHRALAPGLAAVQWHLSTAEQRRGLATAACLPPRQESWLVAGGGEPGRAERLVLVNPGANAVTADVRVLGAAGPRDGAGGRGVVVPAGGRTVVLLDAVAPGEQAPVVHVTTTGGPLVAAVSDRWLDGTTDQGIDLVTPAAEPALEQVVPVLPGEGAGAQVRTTLRLAVPGDSPAVVQLRELGPQGALRPAPDVVRVGAGSTADVEVGGLTAGTGALQVVSDVPVVAAAQVVAAGAPRKVGDVTGSSAASGDGAGATRAPGPAPEDPGAVAELAWVPAAPAVAALAGTPLPSPAGVEHRLVLSAVSGGAVEVTTVRAGQHGSQEVRVPPGGSRVVPLDDADAVWVRPLGEPVRAGVLATGADAGGPYLAVLPLQDAAVERPVLAVRPERP